MQGKAEWKGQMAGSETKRFTRAGQRRRDHFIPQDPSQPQDMGKGSMKAGVHYFCLGRCLEQPFSYSPHLLKMLSASEERSCPGVQKELMFWIWRPGFGSYQLYNLMPSFKTFASHTLEHEVQAPWLGSQDPSSGPWWPLQPHLLLTPSHLTAKYFFWVLCLHRQLPRLTSFPSSFPSWRIPIPLWRHDPGVNHLQEAFPGG